MSFQALKDERKATHVMRQIVEAVQGGRMRVGDRLPPEKELAALMGVGRSSVREALSMLQIAGVLEIRHGSGTYIRAVPEAGFFEGGANPFAANVLDGEDFVHLTEARYAFEQGVAHLASRRREKVGLAKMESALAMMERSARGGDSASFLDANIRFHEGLVDATGNRALRKLAEPLLGQLGDERMRRIRSFFYAIEEGRIGVAYGFHRAIYVGVAEGDVAGALEGLRLHYANVTASLLEGEDS